MNEYMHYKVLEDKLNVKFLEQILRFAYETSDKEVQKSVYAICNKSIFTYADENDETIQSEYDFRYFGELLERHSQKITDSIENIRALAIGFAILENVLPDEMYVANQKNNFIKELETYSDDMLIKLALDRVKQRDKIVDYDFKATEEIIMAVMLSPEFCTAVDYYKDKLIFFLGEGRTISAEDNGALFSWLSGRIKNDRIAFKKKTDELLRALSCIGYKNIKPGSKEFDVLCKYGYTEEDIWYLSYYSVIHGHQYGKIDAKGMVGERIAIGFVTCFLNSEKKHCEYTYDMINRAYKVHRNFRIKCNGCDSLYLATFSEVKIVCPYTLSKVWDIFKNDCIKWIDYFDDKWDSLYEYLDTEVYNSFFVDMLDKNKVSKTTLKKYITRYYKVTGTRLKELFSDKAEFDYDTIRLINILMQHKLFDAWEYSEKTENQENRKYFIEKSMLGSYMLPNKFEFWKKYFEKYSIEKALKEYGDKFERTLMCCVDESRYSSGNSKYYFSFYKLHLSEECQKEYLSWLEEFVYLTRYKSYISFMVAVISDSETKKLIEFKRRKEIYDELKKIRPEIIEDSNMQKEYLTAKELQEIERKKKQKEYEKEYLEELNSKKNFEDKFRSYYKGDYASLYKFVDYNRWEIHKDMNKKVLNVFKALCRTKDCTEEGEFKAFLSICQYLAGKEGFSYAELKKLITEME